MPYVFDDAGELVAAGEVLPATAFNYRGQIYIKTGYYLPDTDDAIVRSVKTKQLHRLASSAFVVAYNPTPARCISRFD